MKIAIYGKGNVRGRLVDLWVRKASLLLKRFHISLSTVMVVAFALSIPTLGQNIDSPELRLGTILGEKPQAPLARRFCLLCLQ